MLFEKKLLIFCLRWKCKLLYHLQAAMQSCVGLQRNWNACICTQENNFGLSNSKLGPYFFSAFASLVMGFYFLVACQHERQKLSGLPNKQAVVTGGACTKELISCMRLLDSLTSTPAWFTPHLGKVLVVMLFQKLFIFEQCCSFPLLL